MILADTNVWIDHFSRPEPELTALLARRQVLMHPFVFGELALGSIGARRQVLTELARLLEVLVATQDEVVDLIETERLFNRGIGYVDAHILASLHLTPTTLLWTRDKRLRAAAAQLGLAADLA